MNNYLGLNMAQKTRGWRITRNVLLRIKKSTHLYQLIIKHFTLSKQKRKAVKVKSEDQSGCHNEVSMLLSLACPFHRQSFNNKSRLKASHDNKCQHAIITSLSFSHSPSTISHVLRPVMIINVSMLSIYYQSLYFSQS